MERRLFLASAASAALLFVMPERAAAQLDGDWAAFEGLGGLFERLRQITDPIADNISRTKFLWFLNRLQEPLWDILQEKGNVQRALRIADCAGDRRSVIALADQSARKIVPLADELSNRMRVLASAIKPADTRQEAAQLADRLGALQNRKMWTNRVGQFCGDNAAGRQRFLAEVEASIAVVKEARLRLENLMEKIS
ncbi:MAG: hypothetical protein AB7E24_09570 [Novosphingobium sp.]